MRKSFIFFLLGFCSLNLFSQNDSIPFLIKNIPDSKNETISKSRRLIVDLLYGGDIQQIKQVKDYLLNQVVSSKSDAFNFKEYSLLLFWTEDYEELTSYIADLGLSPAIRAEITKTTYSQLNDKFYEQILSKTIGEKSTIEEMIEGSTCSEEDKDFLNLFLSYSLMDIYVAGNQDSLNILADEFLLQYPFSTYAPFIKKVILNKVQASDFAFAYTFYGGYAPLGGSLSELFDPIGLFGFSMELFYKDFSLDLSLSLSGAALKKDIPVGSFLWAKDMESSIFIPQFELGYTLLSVKRLSFTPYLGGGVFQFSPIYDDMLNYSYLDELYFTSNFSWNVGFGIQLFSKPAVSTHFRYRSHMFQLFLQLKYHYTHIVFADKYEHFNGGLHQITLRFGALTRRVYKIY